MCVEMIADKKGFFLVFDGIDGSGKSTQVQRLYEYAMTNHIKIHRTAEPSGGVIGRLIRNYIVHTSTHPAIDALLFAADRIEHCEKDIKPFLEEGYLVVSDRYVDSSIVYQSVQGEDKGLDKDWLETINKFIIPADLIIIFDISSDVSLLRKEKQIKREGGVREKYERKQFQEKIREAFLSRAKDNPEKYRIINANRSEEEVFKEILTILEEVIDLKEFQENGKG